MHVYDGTERELLRKVNSAHDDHSMRNIGRQNSETFGRITGC
jgi:hypothetical protein